MQTMDPNGGAGGAGLAPHKVFTVPEGVRWLSPERMEALSGAFHEWSAGARRADSRRSRERMRLLFLMLRYSGARLGEVTSMDDVRDLDLERALASVGQGERRREVPLPRVLCRELSSFLDGPMGAGLRGEVFAMDHGYVRRVFYARADECGLARELACPSALRSTRAVELLRCGVPLAVVCDMLGQSSKDLASVFQSFSSDDAHRIVRRLAPDDMGLRTSARNAFLCRVTSVVRDGFMAEVGMETASGLPLYAVITAESLDNLELRPGVTVAASVKAPLVDVGTGGPRKGSARNAVQGVVAAVRTSAVLAEVTAVAPDGTPLCALVSAGAIEALGLGPGDIAEFRFKAMAVVLGAV